MRNFAYDCIDKIAPSYFHSFFELVDSIHQCSTLQASKIGIFLTHENTTQNCLLSVPYYGAMCRNDISAEIKSHHLQIIFDKN